MTPGSNLYLQAIRLIRPLPVLYLQFIARQQNEARQWVPSFQPAKKVFASVQAVQRGSYNELGLDLQKNYTKFWMNRNIIDLGRDSSGDRFIFDGLLFQIEDQTTWYVIDGWASAMAVEVGSAPPVVDGFETKIPYKKVVP